MNLMERLPHRQPQEKKTMDEWKSEFTRLIASFSRAANFEAKPLRGVVENVDTFESEGKKVYVLHVKNGGQREAFWLNHNDSDPDFRAPRQGDLVKGVINAYGAGVEFAGETHKPLFDFKNLSNNSERAASAWFRTQTANQQPWDAKASDSLRRRIGLRPN
jgi:hypothetical protein